MSKKAQQKRLLRLAQRAQEGRPNSTDRIPLQDAQEVLDKLLQRQKATVEVVPTPVEAVKEQGPEYSKVPVTVQIQAATQLVGQKIGNAITKQNINTMLTKAGQTGGKALNVTGLFIGEVFKSAHVFGKSFWHGLKGE